jgi:hypothetical protein
MLIFRKGKTNMKKILFFLSFFISLGLYARPSSLFRPTGNDILNNCSEFVSNYQPTERVLAQDPKKILMYFLCLTAVNNTYQTIRGPMIVMRNADMVCYQDYYHLEEKSDNSILIATVDYIKKHSAISDSNLSTIMSLMMNEYFPIPNACKK